MQKKNKKGTKQNHKVHFLIRPTACSHLAQHITTRVNQTKYHETADPQPEPCSACSQWYPQVVHGVLNTWSGCIMWRWLSQTDLPLTLTLSLLTLPTHINASQHLLPVGHQTHTAEKASGGLTKRLSKWWVAELLSVGWQLHWWLEDWKVEPVGRSSVPVKSPPCCPGQGGQPHLANGWYSTNAVHLKQPGCRNKKQNLLWTSNSQTTPARDLTYTEPCWNMKGPNVLHWGEHSYTFPIQVPSLKCYIKWLALNKPKWASAKWLIPTQKITASKICWFAEPFHSQQSENQDCY